MKKRSFDISFKKEVVEYCAANCVTPYQAVKHFRDRDDFQYSQSMFYQWFRNSDKICKTSPTKKRATGAGRKPLLGEVENVLADEIAKMSTAQLEVTRQVIADKAKQLAHDHNIENFSACESWISKFLERHCINSTVELPSRKKNVSQKQDDPDNKNIKLS